uniref:Uncharacterized protein n=1 Tax=viral metagenome TaxID=1070528 RepID=A0A6M3JHD3_9ZZZZ
MNSETERRKACKAARKEVELPTRKNADCYCITCPLDNAGCPLDAKTEGRER